MVINGCIIDRQTVAVDLRSRCRMPSSGDDVEVLVLCNLADSSRFNSVGAARQTSRHNLVDLAVLPGGPNHREISAAELRRSP